MRRRALLLGAAALGCSREAPPASALARGLLELSEASVHTPRQVLDWAPSELARVVQRVAARHAHGSSPAKALAHVLFDDLGFVREVESTKLDFVLLPGVLQTRRGSCVGLGTLYLCVAEALGFTAHGVLRPGHFYVRQQAPEAACNVELLRRGELMPDAWYTMRFPLDPIGSSSYGRALSTREVLGVTAFNIGNELRRQQQLQPAERAYARAVADFPGFAEAHAGLGAIQQLLGNRGGASRCYARALELDPTLPGVEKNLALLGPSP